MVLQRGTLVGGIQGHVDGTELVQPEPGDHGIATVGQPVEDAILASGDAWIENHGGLLFFMVTRVRANLPIDMLFVDSPPSSR